MKTTVLLTLLAAAGTCAPPAAAPQQQQQAGGTVELRNLKTGGYAAAEPTQPQTELARDKETYERMWSSLIGDGPAPAVDFAKESVVFLLAGRRNTGGWSIEPKGAAMEGETLVIDAAINGPPPGSIVTQALTSPFAVVAVNARQFKDVRWKR